MKITKYAKFITIIIIAVSLSACSNIKKEASYPTRDGRSPSDKIIYSDQKKDTIWGEGETLASRFFGKNKEDAQGGSGIGVNSFLWRASLDTISFMPVNSADPFGGVIITDWYEDPDVSGERFKMNIYIMDRQLRSDGVKVSVFKQKLDKNGSWRDAKVATDTNLKIENTILTRARELKVAQQAAK